MYAKQQSVMCIVSAQIMLKYIVQFLNYIEIEGIQRVCRGFPPKQYIIEFRIIIFIPYR